MTEKQQNPLEELVQQNSEAFEAALADAQAYGGGWMLTDTAGRITRIAPRQVLAWAEEQRRRRG